MAVSKSFFLGGMPKIRIVVDCSSCADSCILEASKSHSQAACGWFNRAEHDLGIQMS